MRFITMGCAAAVVCVSTAAIEARAQAQVPAGGSAVFPSDSVLSSDDLIRVFGSACLEGAAKFTPGEAAPVSLAELPPTLRQRFGAPLSGTVWRLNSTEPSYLYVLNYKPGRNISPTVCGIASAAIVLRPAMDFLGKRVNGPALGDLHSAVTGAEWLSPQEGYIAVATKAGDFTIMELKELTRKQQRQALRNVRGLDLHGPPAWVPQ